MADKTTTYIEATYTASERFKWPKNIDIKGEGITYYVKWGCLNIFKGDELIAEIKAKYPANECDGTYKRPNSTDEIEDDDESDEEDEDEDEEGPCDKCHVEIDRGFHTHPSNGLKLCEECSYERPCADEEKYGEHSNNHCRSCWMEG